MGSNRQGGWDGDIFGGTLRAPLKCLKQTGDRYIRNHGT
jgi:hypothetical protein